MRFSDVCDVYYNGLYRLGLEITRVHRAVRFETAKYMKKWVGLQFSVGFIQLHRLTTVPRGELQLKLPKTK